MVDPEELIPSDDAAPLVHVKPETMPQWRCAGRGPKYYRVGRRIYYRRSDISTWIAEQMCNPAAKRNAAKA